MELENFYHTKHRIQLYTRDNDVLFLCWKSEQAQELISRRDEKLLSNMLEQITRHPTPASTDLAKLGGA